MTPQQSSHGGAEFGGGTRGMPLRGAHQIADGLARRATAQQRDGGEHPALGREPTHELPQIVIVLSCGKTCIGLPQHAVCGGRHAMQAVLAPDRRDCEEFVVGKLALQESREHST
jgi:hypothetical protein